MSKYDVDDFLERLSKMYKELPNYLKTPTKRSKTDYNLSGYGKEILEKIQMFLKRKWLLKELLRKL